MDEDEAHRRYYHWWTFASWNNRSDRGVKFGPVTVHAYHDGRWFYAVSILGRCVIDTWKREE